MSYFVLQVLYPSICNALWPVIKVFLFLYFQGNVLDGVLKYQKMLSKPIGDSGTNYVTFTPLYLDGSGLGMMTTVSTGVFAKVASKSSSSLHSSSSSSSKNFSNSQKEKSANENMTTAYENIKTNTENTKTTPRENTKANTATATELIGVAGIDIVISLLEQHYPIQEMGIFGHAFIINNNGLFLMHPKFKDQSGYDGFSLLFLVVHWG